MQVSTDLPYGSKQLLQQIASGASLRANVIQEADAAFIAELRRVDPERHARLIRNMQTAVLRRPAALNKGGRPMIHRNEAARRRANARYQARFRQKNQEAVTT